MSEVVAWLIAGLLLVASGVLAFFLKLRSDENTSSGQRNVKLQKELKRLKSEVVRLRKKTVTISDETKLDELRLFPEDLTYDLRQESTYLGRGAFGVVLKGQYRGQTVAIKVLLKRDEANMEHLTEEALLMYKLRHPNIVHLVGILFRTKYPCIVMEFAALGNMRNVLRSRNVSLTWNDPKLRWAEEVASSIRYLHRAQRFDDKTLSYTVGIVHRDIKITDFGESVDRADKEQLGIVGTPKFVAPEVLQGLDYGSKADVYSYGIVLSELATAKKPYHDFTGTGSTLTQKIFHGLRPTVREGCMSKRLRDIMKRCWAADPRKRPTMDEVLDLLSKCSEDCPPQAEQEEKEEEEEGRGQGTSPRSPSSIAKSGKRSVEESPTEKSPRRIMSTTANKSMLVKAMGENGLKVFDSEDRECDECMKPASWKCKDCRPYDKLISIVLCDDCNGTLHALPTRVGHKVFCLERERMLVEAKKAKAEHKRKTRAEKKKESVAALKKSNTAVFAMLMNRNRNSVATDDSEPRGSLDVMMGKFLDQSTGSTAYDDATWTGGETNYLMAGKGITIRNAQDFEEEQPKSTPQTATSSAAVVPFQ